MFKITGVKPILVGIKKGEKYVYINNLLLYRINKNLSYAHSNKWYLHVAANELLIHVSRIFLSVSLVPFSNKLPGFTFKDINYA